MNWPQTSPELFQSTLRDGFYINDFQFTANDTATIGCEDDLRLAARYEVPFVRIGPNIESVRSSL